MVTDRGYEELLAHAPAMEIAAGIAVRVLDLETVIELKEALGRDKDRASVAVLRRTLAERSRRA